MLLYTTGLPLARAFSIILIGHLPQSELVQDFEVILVVDYRLICYYSRNMERRSNKKWKIPVGAALFFIILYSILLIPGQDYSTEHGGGKKPFVWNQDQQWSELEAKFVKAKTQGRDKLIPRISELEIKGWGLLDSMHADSLSPDAAIFSQIEDNIFELAPIIGACPQELGSYEALLTRLRQEIKLQSRHWDMISQEARRRVYRLLYGSREALEEILLQMPGDSISSLLMETDEPSMTPSTKILGVTIHSGDILVSRGGAPTSALIARGNDYPGNFSHVALVYVDDKTNLPSIIESHIERGVIVSTLGEYLRDTKLRVMILRLRSDMPQMEKDPMLPHKAARLALESAKAHHIPYDFDMDFNDHTREFCSEVASAPYDSFGVHLWMGKSTISSPGLVSWLAAFGVHHFETQEPSDLEYDPQLQVVAEWRDPETLYKDHVDNAVIDAMLEGAESGDRLDYQWYLLPVARILKVYSSTLNLMDIAGPIPEGMNAAAALRNKQFSSCHGKIKKRVLNMAEEFTHKYGYRPPYWELVNLARTAKNEMR